MGMARGGNAKFKIQNAKSRLQGDQPFVPFNFAFSILHF
jgi:hypothetical protein